MTNLETTFELIARASAGRIVDCLVLGMLIAGLSACIARLAKKKGSGLRFSFWFATLVAIAIIPVAGGLASVSQAGFVASPVQQARVTLPASWALYLFAIWAAVASVGVTRVALGVWQLFRLRRDSELVDMTAIDPQLNITLANNSGSRAIALRVSDKLTVPTAIGLVSPAIVMPRWALEELSSDELNQILLHESAHLRRWDDWTNLIQKVIGALLFFHPAVWWIERNLSLEREMACDDAVLAQTASPRAYAECLAHLAEKTWAQKSTALAQAAVGRVRQTSHRIARILAVNGPVRARQSWKVAVPMVAGFAMVSAVAVQLSPSLVAFSDGTPSRVTAAAVPAVISNNSDSFPLGMQIVPARLRTSSPVMVEKHSRVRRAVQPKQNRQVSSGEAVTADNVASQVTVPTELIHPAKAADEGVRPYASEAVFVVVQSTGISVSGDPIYEIRVWKMVVYHPAQDSDSKKAPAKQT